MHDLLGYSKNKTIKKILKKDGNLLSILITINQRNYYYHVQ